MKKDLLIFLGLQISSIVWAALVFAIVPVKVLAGALGAFYFAFVAGFMLYRILRWPRWWTAWTLYPLLLFLFGVLIPMIWVRFTHINQPFSELKVLGIPGPEFHHVSSSTLGLLIVVTLAELIYSSAKGRGEIASGRSKLS